MTSPSESSLSSGGGMDGGDAPLSQFDREVSEPSRLRPQPVPHTLNTQRKDDAGHRWRFYQDANFLFGGR